MDWAIIDSGCWVEFMDVFRWKRRRAGQSWLKECMEMGDWRWEKTTLRFGRWDIPK